MKKALLCFHYHVSEAVMTIALLDDSSKDISLLYEYICRYCNEHKVHASIKQFDHEKIFSKLLNLKI